MKVLVLGGAGFIGPRLMRLLLERGHDVACMDVNVSSPLLDPLRHRVALSRGDVTLMDDVMRAMLETKPDRVVNLAYLLGSGDEDPHLGVRINVMGMDNCFEAARLCGIKRVTYASSLAVYGLQKHFGERMLNEEDLRHGIGVYAVSKIFNEHQAEWYNKAYGMAIVGVRPANVTGPDKVRGSMEHVRCVVLPAQGLPVRFRYRDMMWLPIHVEDTAEIFARVTLAETTRHEVYNSGGESISIGGIAEIVRSYLPDAQIEFENEEGGHERSGNYLMDNTRLREEFEITLAPYRQRVLEIINAVREAEGMPLVAG